MAEYIEREALLQKIEKWDEKAISEYDVGYFDCLNAIEDTIADLPTADVQEVVRCNDCIHCCMSYNPKTKISRKVCGYVGYNPVQSAEVTDYDFCSNGEKIKDKE